MLALLAWVCLPGLAQASSAGYEYKDAPPTATPPSESNLSGGSKSTSGIGSHAGSSSTDGSKGGNSSTAGKDSSPKGTGNEAGGKAGSGHDQENKPKGSAHPGTAKLTGAGTAPGTDDGGSSPLIPILIAIAVLAAASVAYVVAKRRREKGADPTDSSPSPEAS
jgi:cobalamin biosynthesis Mg chelatase CobN